MLNNDANYFFVKTDANAFNIYKDTTTTDESALGTPVLSSVAYTASSWNHVALVCRSNGSVTMYVNGSDKGSFTIDSSDSLREILFSRGRWHAGSDSAFYRALQSTWFDDAALFKGTLSSASIGKIAEGTQVLTALLADTTFLKPYASSININFTNGNGLTTGDDVGLAGYAVPGTSWNNFAGDNGTYSTVKAVDPTGAATVASDVSVTVSGTRGYYSCSTLASGRNPLHGYIDENANNPTPTFITDDAPKAHQEKITEELNKLNYGITTQVQFTTDGHDIHEQIKALDFAGTPLIIGSNWEKKLAIELGAHYINVSYPMLEKLVINDHIAGYSGGLHLLEQIFTAAMSKLKL